MATPKKQQINTFRIVFSNPRPYDFVEAVSFTCVNDNVVFFGINGQPTKAYSSKAGVLTVEEVDT